MAKAAPTQAKAEDKAEIKVEMPNQGTRACTSKKVGKNCRHKAQGTASPSFGQKPPVPHQGQESRAMWFSIIFKSDHAEKEKPKPLLDVQRNSDHASIVKELLKNCVQKANLEKPSDCQKRSARLHFPPRPVSLRGLGSRHGGCCLRHRLHRESDDDQEERRQDDARGNFGGPSVGIKGPTFSLATPQSQPQRGLENVVS